MQSHGEVGDVSDDGGIRLAKRVAAQANCSRREAELLIEAGAVQVDGAQALTPQARIRSSQRIDIDRSRAPAERRPPPAVTLLLHKPAGVAFDAPAARLIDPARRSDDAAAMRPFLARHLAAQHCVTPLETGASGLVVLTQESGIARRLLDDAPLMENEWLVDITGPISAGRLRRLNESPIVDGRAMLPAKVSISRQSEAQTGLRFAIKGAWQGQIAQMCDAAGLRIVAMKRIRVGRVPLAGLAPGAWRFLLSHERF